MKPLRQCKRSASSAQPHRASSNPPLTHLYYRGASFTSTSSCNTAGISHTPLSVQCQCREETSLTIHQQRQLFAM